MGFQKPRGKKVGPATPCSARHSVHRPSLTPSPVRCEGEAFECVDKHARATASAHDLVIYPASHQRSALMFKVATAKAPDVFRVVP